MLVFCIYPKFEKISLLNNLGGIGLSREGSTQSLNEDDDFRDHNMALRYRFYNRLDPGGSQLVRIQVSHTFGKFFCI